MARLARLAIAGQVHHLLHAAHPTRRLCSTEADMGAFREALLDVSRETDVKVHAYVLLPSRLQLLVTPATAETLINLMQRFGRRFISRLNALNGTSGSPWAGRYRSTVIQPKPYLLEAMRAIDMAPVAEGLVGHADQWAASSAAHNFGKAADPLITPHSVFWQLGNTPFEREARYREWCAEPPRLAATENILAATQKGWVLGDPHFVDSLTATQARRLQPARRGRPPRTRKHE